MSAQRLAHILAATLCALLVGNSPAAAEGRWLRGESAHFIFYSDGTETRLRRSAETLERFDALLRALSQPPVRIPPPKLEIYLFQDPTTLRAVAPRLPSHVAGFYVAAPDIVAAFAAYQRTGEDWAQQLLFHEYVHHFMLHHFPNAYPAWYVEGFAEYLQTARFEQERVVIGEPSSMRAGTLLAGPGLPLRQILAPNRLNERAAQQFYAQSWLLTHYLFAEPERRTALRNYLDAIGGGADPVGAFEPAFSVGLGAFENALSRYKRGEISAYAYQNPLNADANVQISRLPEAANDLLTLNIRMRGSIPNEGRVEFGRRVARIAARHGNDPYAQRALAGAALWANEPARARSILEPLIAANSDDTDALFLMGLSYNLEASLGPPEEWAETAALGRRYFARASRIAPDNFTILYFYSITYMLLPEPMPDTALDVLIKAHLLAPQVHRISLETAREMMEAGLFDEAVPILRRLAFAPHARNMNEQAQALLDLALRRQAPPPRTPNAFQTKFGGEDE